MSKAAPLPNLGTPRRRVRILDDHLERDGAGVDGLRAGYRLWTPDDAALPERPILDPAALYGLPGEVVRLLEPETEADPAAILGTFLASLASLAGSGPHVVVGSTRHPFRLFALVVGPTAAGRKGTSFADARSVLDIVDESFMRDRVQTGFGSGEALVDAVAEPGAGPSGHGLLIVEGEFSRVLRTAQRDGSTLSTIIRTAWDTGKLEVRSRTGTAVAHDAHLCIVGHLTPGDLRRYLCENEVANGFGNRFLVIDAHRSKLLPFGGRVDPKALGDLGQRLRGRLVEARNIGEVTRTPEANELWHDLYHRWASEESDDLVGEMTARAPAQVLRLALGYAVTDASPVITPEHLEAADAVWQYSRASVEHLFGGIVGDADADKLLAAIRDAAPNGLAADEQHRALGRHVKAARLAHVRDDLERRGLIHTFTSPTGGRPRTVGVAIAAAREA